MVKTNASEQTNAEQAKPTGARGQPDNPGPDSDRDEAVIRSPQDREPWASRFLQQVSRKQP
jgi:hypothetical protein